MIFQKQNENQTTKKIYKKNDSITDTRNRIDLIPRAENGTRTRDLRLGKPTLYQLSYFRNTHRKTEWFCKYKKQFPICKKNLFIPAHTPRYSLFRGFHNKTRQCLPSDKSYASDSRDCQPS